MTDETKKIKKSQDKNIGMVISGLVIMLQAR